ncbi:unnamed protein product [Lymnaea stagnalis]|uniref:TUG ubiquitin-like domain-containing protein n=1 Tax=Lymnaea stagnalis TaxID=6523 RepID=A0AAV2I3I2_LYMST
MAASVQVLCPNGRRQNVKINPNTKLLQILEEVCQRQGYIPPEDYKLVQGRKELDLSLSVRFSSIPNNAKLELSKAASARIEQDVTIALQLDSGQRLQDSFKPCASLWDILLHFESKDSEYEGVLSRVDTSHVPFLHPVCIFMREEVVIGEKALQAMTLKKLGLTSGKAIIRLLHRPVEASFLQDIVDNLEKERQKQVKLEEIALKKCELRQIDEMERNRRLDDASLSTWDEEKMDETEASLVSLRSASSQVTEVGPSHPELMEQGANESLSSSTTASDSTSGKPRGQRSKKNSSMSQSQDQVSATSAINDLRNMNIPGVEIFTPDDFSDLSPQEQAIARRLAERFLPHLQTVHSTISAVSEGSEESSFADFKFPEETRGMDLTRSDL